MRGICVGSYMRLFERILARSFVSSFPPLTVSMTRVHHTSPDSLNWVRHFRWLDPSKSLAATSLQPPPPSPPWASLGKGEFTEGLPTYPRPYETFEHEPSGFCFRPQRSRHFEFMIPRESLRCSDTEKLWSLVKVKGGPCPSLAEHAESFSLISDRYAVHGRSLDEWSFDRIYVCIFIVFTL